jgi:hypothetical protein
MNRDELRERWFNEGAVRFQKVLENVGARDLLPPDDYYACPCCLWIFPRRAVTTRELTLEDVPPKKLGGRPLLLTCKECNNASGSKFDSHAECETAFAKFFAGHEGGRPVPVTISGDEVSTRGTAQRTENGLILIPRPDQNHPDEIEGLRVQVREAAAEGEDPGSTFSFTATEGFNRRRAEISWVRAAYLAAFAAFGWRYILRPELDPVRAQLADADAEILPSLGGYDPAAAADRREIKLVEIPEEIRSVLVMMGRYAVFLPGLDEALTCDALSQALDSKVGSGDGVRIRFKGKQIPWPKYPRYLWDGSSR